MSHTTEHFSLSTAESELIPGIVYINVEEGIANARVYVKLVEVDDDGEVKPHGVRREVEFSADTSPTGETVARAINESDHSTDTMHKQLMQTIIDAGAVVGSVVAGDPI